MTSHLHNTNGELAYSDETTVDVLRIIGRIESLIAPLYVRLDGDTTAKILDWLKDFDVEDLFVGIDLAFLKRMEKDEDGIPVYDTVLLAVETVPAVTRAIFASLEKIP
ncbi:hypothetical protein ADL19_14860 [Streptomyces purpurogeneiscleroticus]|nr:hypothetical protein ADL19_14860 [Streptomyces purpurogeneiscleroticus]